jgi:hypothetical protein
MSSRFFMLWRLVGMLAILILALPGAGLVAAKDDLILQEITSPSGGRVVFQVSKWRIKNTPEWKPETGDPPLSVSRASVIAMEFLKPQMPKSLKLEVSSIGIFSILETGVGKRWYYFVQMNAGYTGPTVDWNKLNVIVLMDGQIVAPQAIPKGP